MPTRRNWSLPLLFGVGLGLTILVSTLLVSATIQAGIDELVSPVSDEFQIVGQSVDAPLQESLREELEALDGVESTAGAIQTRQFLANQEIATKWTQARLTQSEFRCERNSPCFRTGVVLALDAQLRSHAIAGRWFEQGRAEAVVDGELLKELGAGLGDKIRIGSLDFQVVGALRSAAFAPSRLVLLPLDPGRELTPPIRGLYTHIFVQLGQDQDPESWINDNAGAIDANVEFLLLESTVEPARDSAEPLRQALLLAAALAVAATFILVVASLDHLIVADRKLHLALRIAGANRSQVLRRIFRRVWSHVGVAILVAVLLGTGLGTVLTGRLSSSLGFHSELGLVFRWPDLLIMACVAVAVTIQALVLARARLGGTIQIREFQGKPPSFLRPQLVAGLAVLGLGGILWISVSDSALSNLWTVGPLALLAVYLTIPWLTKGAYGLMSRLAAGARSPASSVSFKVLASERRMVTRFMAVFVVLVAIVISNGSFRISIDEILEEAFHGPYPQVDAELLLTPVPSAFALPGEPAGSAEDLQAELSRLEGVDFVVPAYLVSAAVHGFPEGPAGFGVLVFDAGEVRNKDIFGGEGLPKGNAVVIDRRLANQLDIGSGDTLTVETKTVGTSGELVELTVSDVSAPSEFSLMASSTTARRFFGEPRPLGLFVGAGGTLSDDLLNRIEGIANGHGFEIESNVDPQLSEWKRRLDEMTNLLLLLLLVTLVLAVVIIFLTFSSFLEGQSGVMVKLRVSGASSRFLRRVIVSEWLTLFLTGMLIAIPTGLAISWMSVSVLNSTLGVGLTWKFPWAWTAAVFVIGLLIALAAIGPLARRRDRDHVVTLKSA